MFTALTPGCSTDLVPVAIAQRDLFSVTRRLPIGWKVGFWAAAFSVFLFLLWLFNAILLPFIIALALGYLLDPLVAQLERLRIGRAGATSVILIASILLVVAAAVIVTPMLARQIVAFLKGLPDLVKKLQGLIGLLSEEITHGWIGRTLTKLGFSDNGMNEIRNTATDLVNKGVAWFVGFANGLVSRGAALLDLVSLLVITPVLAFYLLLDWQRMLAVIDGLVPPRNRDTVRHLAHDIDRALAGFLRGQLLVCLFLAAWYGIGLTLIGLSFGMLIGLTGGVLSFIPYIGSLLVLVLALLVAVVQGWPNWHLFVSALCVVLVGQFLEGNVLSPKLVGDKVGLHPVWIIFALLGFGSVFGFTGLLVAVPVASASGVLIRFATRRYRESPMFTGVLPEPVVDPRLGSRILDPNQKAKEDARTSEPRSIEPPPSARQIA